MVEDIVNDTLRVTAIRCAKQGERKIMNAQPTQLTTTELVQGIRMREVKLMKQEVESDEALVYGSETAELGKDEELEFPEELGLD